MNRKKSKPWTGKEEEALAKAWINVSGDPETGNQQRTDSFWKRMLENFEAQLGNTDRTVHQLNSKWKDMNVKIKKFNVVYNKMANRRSGQSEADILVATLIEYRNLYKMKGFLHQAAWEIVKNHPKWNDTPLMGAHARSSKRTKTSDSNTHTTSSNAQFPTALNKEDEVFHYEEPQGPQGKGKKPALSSSEQQQQREEQLLKIVSEFSSFNKEDMEDKKRHRAQVEEFKKEKLRLMKEEKEKKMLILEEELRMMQQTQMDKDMQFFLTTYDNLTGATLNAVLARKREIAQRWGWE